MQSLDALAQKLSLSREELESSVAGAFVSYTSVKMKSSHIELASTGGTIKKVKKRSPERAVYEFLSLRAWHELLQQYSSSTQLSFRAPYPLGLADLDKEQNILYMEFMNGYELRKIGGNMRRTFPVPINGQDTPLPLYPACALHLGALDRIKENEGLYHGDYDTRHVIFKPVQGASLAVIDVEGSRLESPVELSLESQRMFSDFERITSSQRDRDALKSWHQQGFELMGNSHSIPYLPNIIEKINHDYDIDFNMRAMSINGVSLRDRGST